jgi:hypothetical protein
MLVLDVDPGKGGTDSVLMLQGVYGDLPTTYSVITQSKGVHLYFALPDHVHVSSNAGVIAPGLDIRGDGGYVVGPGSTIADRAYSVVPGTHDLALAPDWLIGLCKAPSPSKPSTNARLIDETPAGVAAAERWLRDDAPAPTEGSRNNTAYTVIAKLLDFGLWDETAHQLLAQWNETNCSPPMGAEEIATIARSAAAKTQNPHGILSPDLSVFEPREIAPRAAATTPTAKETRQAGFATPWRPVEIGKLKRRDWVIPDVACKQNVGMLAGPAGVSKTTFVIAMVLAVVTGREDILGVPIGKRSRVWLWNQEDDLDELLRRLAAAMIQFKVSDSDMVDEEGRPMLFLNSGVDKPLMFAVRTSEFSIRRGPDVDAAIAEIKANNIDMAIFDPLVEFHQGEENDNALKPDLRRGHPNCAWSKWRERSAAPSLPSGQSRMILVSPDGRRPTALAGRRGTPLRDKRLASWPGSGPV